MHVHLKELIKMMIQDMGGEIVDRDDEFIWARLGGGQLEVYYLEDKEEVSGDHVIKFSRDTEQVKGEKAIFCIKGHDKLAQEIAKKMGIVLVSREQLASLIGEFILKLHERGDEIPILQEEDVEVEDIEYEEVEELDDPDIIPIIIDDIESGEEKIIKLNISKNEAINIASAYVGVFKTQLNLKPYYIFEYSFKLIVEGTSDTKLMTGIIAMDAIQGKHEIWKTGFETTANIDIPYIKIEPVKSVDDCENKAKEALIKEFTTEKEVSVEDENITIIEKRKTKPLENSIKINYLGLHYLPVWVCEGREGMVFINATTGEIMEKDMHQFTF